MGGPRVGFSRPKFCGRDFCFTLFSVREAFEQQRITESEVFPCKETAARGNRDAPSIVPSNSFKLLPVGATLNCSHANQQIKTSQQKSGFQDSMREKAMFFRLFLHSVLQILHFRILVSGICKAAQTAQSSRTREQKVIGGTYKCSPTLLTINIPVDINVTGEPSQVLLLKTIHVLMLYQNLETNMLI